MTTKDQDQLQVFFSW